MKRIVLVLVVFALMCTSLFASEGGRFALVMGNGDYKGISPLANPANDATDLATLLEDAGFSVRLETDATLSRMEGAVREFSAEAKAAKAGTTLFFYAGHGVQYEGVNYLLPVDADIQKDYELRSKALSMEMVSSALEDSKSGFNLVLLDACRDNPFSSSRGGSRGLVVMGGGTPESMVVFATSPGAVAQDGGGSNSPFTTALKEYLLTPDLEIRQLVASVSKKVQDMTKGMQIPWVNTSFTGSFYFVTAQQQIQRVNAEATRLQAELAALEQEIAQRQKNISGETNALARQKLELEQQRTKALEASKKLEVQRMDQIRKQAEYEIAVQEKNLAEKRALETTVKGQQEELARQAAKRRTELAELDRKRSMSSDALERLDMIAKMEKAISDIERSFALSIAGTKEELERLQQQQVGSYQTTDPQDPWETQTEFNDRIAAYRAALVTEGEAKVREIERQGDAEVSKIGVQLEQAKRELQSMQFTLGPASTKVTVEKFDAANKRFPIKVSSTDSDLPFEVSLFFKIESTERDKIQKEYLRVDDADKANALVGTILYRLKEIAPSLWSIEADGTTVLSLLEGAVENQVPIVSIRMGESFNGDTVISLDKEILRQLEGGSIKSLFALVPIISSMGKATVSLDGNVIGTTDTAFIAKTAKEGGYKTFNYLFKNGIKFSTSTTIFSGINNPISPSNLVRPNHIIKYDAHAMVDKNNGDGKLNPGETVVLDMRVKNTGSSTVLGLKAKMSSESPYVKWVKNEFVYGNVSAGDTLTGLGKAYGYSSYSNLDPSRSVMELAVSSSAPVGTVIPIKVDFTDTQGNAWEDAFTITVVKTGAVVKYDAYSMSDKNNGDGKLNPGETVVLDMRVKNTGSSTVLGLKAKMSSESPYVKWVKNEFVYGNVSAGDTLTGLGKAYGYSSYSNLDPSRSVMELSVSSSAPVGTVIPIKVDFTDTQGNAWEDAFTITVVKTGAVVKYDAYSMSDKNNGDGKLNPGETVVLDMRVKNTGSSTVLGLKAKMSSESPYVKWVKNEFVYGNVSAGDTLTGLGKAYGYSSYSNLDPSRSVMELSVSSSAPVGTVIPIKVDFTDTQGNAWEDAFTITVVKTGAVVKYDAYSMSDKNNGDGKLNPGETVVLDMRVKNTGSSTVLGLKAKMSSESPYVKWVKNEFVYGNVSAGDTLTGLGKAYGYSSYSNLDPSRSVMELSVSSSTPVGTVIPIKVDFTDTQGNAWEDAFTITVVK